MWIFIQATIVWVESAIAYGEVGVVCSGFRVGDDAYKGGVIMMTLVRCLYETLFGVMCVEYLVCAAQRL